MDHRSKLPCLEPCESATEALERLRVGNKRFMTAQTQFHRVDLDWRRMLTMGQRPFAIVLTCSDSRVVPEMVFDQGLGDLFVLRVAGCVVTPSILGSIEYAIHEFRVKCVVVLGHDFCGGVQAVLNSRQKRSEKSNTLIERNASSEKLPYFAYLVSKIRIGTRLSQVPHKASQQAVRHNLFYQTTVLVRKSTYLARMAESHELCIVPALYHLEIGEVEWFYDVKFSQMMNSSQSSVRR